MNMDGLFEHAQLVAYEVLVDLGQLDVGVGRQPHGGHHGPHEALGGLQTVRSGDQLTRDRDHHRLEQADLADALDQLRDLAVVDLAEAFADPDLVDRDVLDALVGRRWHRRRGYYACEPEGTASAS